MLVVYTILSEASERYFAEADPTGAPPAYRQRLTDMKSAAARARTRAGLWLLEQALVAHRPGAGGLDRLGFSAHGRPQLADGPAFSIAHSDALVACALAENGAVGLDVEARRDGISPRLVRLIASDDPAADFFAHWCAREATVKASGRVGLARIRAIRLDEGRAWLDGRGWSLRPLALADGYCACLASDAPIGPVASKALVSPGRE